jgi:hypothetical protein
MAGLFRLVVVLIALLAAFWVIGTVIFAMLAWTALDTKYAEHHGCRHHRAV